MTACGVPIDPCGPSRSGGRCVLLSAGVLLLAVSPSAAAPQTISQQPAPHSRATLTAGAVPPHEEPGAQRGPTAALSAGIGHLQQHYYLAYGGHIKAEAYDEALIGVRVGYRLSALFEPDITVRSTIDRDPPYRDVMVGATIQLGSRSAWSLRPSVGYQAAFDGVICLTEPGASCPEWIRYDSWGVGLSLSYRSRLSRHLILVPAVGYTRGLNGKVRLETLAAAVGIGLAR